MIDASAVDNINIALGKTSDAQTNLDQTFNDFVKLLVTQLENQDPTDPLDTAQITDQITGMSQVQEQLNTNKHLAELVAMGTGSQLDSVVNYIGRVVEAKGNQSMMISNGEESGAVFVYDLPNEANDVIINIYDDTDKLVYSGPALNHAGRNEVVWDGINAFNQQQMEPGAYSFTIKATDFNGNEMEATTYTTGIVTSADTHEGEVSLSLGQIKVDVDEVLAVKTNELL